MTPDQQTRLVNHLRFVAANAGIAVHAAQVKSEVLPGLLDELERDIKAARNLSLGQEPPCPPDCDHDHVPFG